MARAEVAELREPSCRNMLGDYPTSLAMKHRANRDIPHFFAATPMPKIEELSRMESKCVE